MEAQGVDGRVWKQVPHPLEGDPLVVDLKEVATISAGIPDKQQQNK